METIVQSSPTVPRRRAAKSVGASVPTAAKLGRAKKKLPRATIETTADAFMVLFKSLPGVVKWRIVQKIEEYEDEFDAQEFAAARAAADASPEKSIPFDQVMAEYEVLHQVKLT